MKKMIFALLTLTALNSFAGNGVERFEKLNWPIDFSRATDLSGDAKERIEMILSQRCQPAANTASKVSIRNLQVLQHRVDQGVVDLTYKFDVILHGWDQYEHDVISMELVEYDISNPTIDKFNLVDLKADEGICQ